MDTREPQWSPEQHLDHVYKRGRLLRRRRRLLAGAGPALVALVAFSVVGLSHTPATSSVHAVANGPTGVTSPRDGHAGRAEGDASAGDATGSQSGTAPQNGASAASAAQPGQSPASSSATSGSQSGTASGPQGGQLDHGAPSPSPSSPPGPSPQTAAPMASPPCATSDLAYSTMTDRSSYARGQQVAISLVVTNRSSHPCDAPSVCGVGPWASVVNRTGTVVWRSYPIAIACSNPPPPSPRLAPGQSTSYGAGTWDEATCTSSACPGPPAASGSYRAIAHRGDTSATSVRFTLTG